MKKYIPQIGVVALVVCLLIRNPKPYSYLDALKSACGITFIVVLVYLFYLWIKIIHRDKRFL